MADSLICPQCLQPNEPQRVYCWRCNRSLQAEPTSKDYEKVFNLRGTWGMPELKRAYHREANSHHPDKHPGNRDMETTFKYINKAYEELCKKLNMPMEEEEVFEPSEPRNDPTLDHLSQRLVLKETAQEPPGASLSTTKLLLAILIIAAVYLIAIHSLSSRTVGATPASTSTAAPPSSEASPPTPSN